MRQKKIPIYGPFNGLPFQETGYKREINGARTALNGRQISDPVPLYCPFPVSIPFHSNQIPVPTRSKHLTHVSVRVLERPLESAKYSLFLQRVQKHRYNLQTDSLEAIQRVLQYDVQIGSA